MRGRFTVCQKLCLVLALAMVGFWSLSERAAAKTEPKGSIVIAVTSIADEPVDPAKSKTNIDRPMTDSVGEPLVWRNQDGQVVPGIATSWRILPGTNNLGWEFKIKKGVKFWDGTELTVEDVKFSIERAKKPETA